MSDHDIDAVIAWVDGGDPAHRAARARYAGETRQGDGGDLRFVQSNEIHAAIASILKYAPFIRHIWIVTDNQRPPHLGDYARQAPCAPDRIRLVDHDVIFDGLPAARPNFNTRAIEAALHRIPGLSEHFVYFNDDMFVNSPAAPATFFDADGRPRIGGDWQVPSHRRLKKRAETAIRRLIGRPDLRPSHQVVQETGAALMGYTDRFLRTPHCPHPLRVSTMQAALARHPGLLDAQVRYRFRDRAQYQPVALANHAEISDGLRPEPPPDIAYLRAGSGPGFQATLQRISDGRATFACLQDVEALPDNDRQRLLGILAGKFGPFLPDPIRKEWQTP